MYRWYTWNLWIAPEVSRKGGARLAPKTRLGNRKREKLAQNRQHALFDEELLLDVGSFRKPEDPRPVHVEGHAVVAFAEVRHRDRGKIRELFRDQTSVEIRVNRQVVSHCEKSAPTSADRRRS